jgi:ABC-type Na+ efflux pump permease subunit
VAEPSALSALMGLELRRTLPPVLRTVGLAVVAAVALGAFDAVTPSRVLLLVTFVAVSGIGTIFQNVIRDKLAGGLEFLIALPVDRRVLALSRTAACAVVALPAGGALTAAGCLALQAAGMPRPGVVATASLFVVCAAGVAAFAILAMGISLRLKAAHFANLVMAAFLVGLGVVWVTSHVFHPSRATLVGLTMAPWFTGLTVLAAGALLSTAAWVGYGLARTGLERFKPERDQVSW